MVPVSEASFVSCLLVFLKRLSSAGLSSEEGEAGAPHLQLLVPAPAMASGKPVTFFCMKYSGFPKPQK